AAARHHREAVAGEAAAEPARQLVVAMRLREARGAEHGDAWADEVQDPEAANKLAEDPEGAGELEEARLGTGQEAPHFGRPRRLAPPAVGRRIELSVHAHEGSPSAPTLAGLADGDHGAHCRSVSGGWRMILGVPTEAVRWLTPESLPR